MVADIGRFQRLVWWLRPRKIYLIERDVISRGLISADRSDQLDLGSTQGLDTTNPGGAVDQEFALVEVTGADFYQLERVRLHHRQWLEPWEATSPPESADPALSLRAFISQSRRQCRQGQLVQFMMVLDQEIVGALTISAIQGGAVLSGSLGYWISPDFAGRGVTTLAVAMAIDCALTDLGLHRVEVNIRPENMASLRVVQKLGLREEGLRPRYVHINGNWADHRAFAITVEEVPSGGMVGYLEHIFRRHLRG